MTHACYLLRSLNPRFKTSFYIGCTTDPRRRLRQHNGEVAQGAQFTKKKRPWEMVVCVYGFTSHVNALQFEWAWQHPLVSLSVKEAAAKLPSLKGVPGMIKLVCTMVTLPRWNSVNLTLQFMLSSLLQHRHGSPPLPPQMRLVVASMDSLPGKDFGGDNDDNDDLSTSPDELSQSLQLDEDSYLNASSITVNEQERVIEDGLTAERYASHDITSSPCPKRNGKKSRKGKTPLAMKGKGGATQKLSENAVLIDLQVSGSGSRTLFAGEEMSDTERDELNDCAVSGHSRLTVTTMETMCTSSESQGERIDCYRNTVDLSDLSAGERIDCYWNTVDLSDLSAGERIPLYLDSKDNSLETDCRVSCSYSTIAKANVASLKVRQENRAGSDEFLNEEPTRFENRASVTKLSTSETTLARESSRGQCTDFSTVSEDLSCWSIADTTLSKDLVKEHDAEGPTLTGCGSLRASVITKAGTQAKCVGHSEGEKIGFHEVSEEHNIPNCSEESGKIDHSSGSSDDLSSKSIGERISSDGVVEDQSQKSRLVDEGDSRAKSANQELDVGDSDIEEISVEEFRTGARRIREIAVPLARRPEGGGRCLLPPIADCDTLSMFAKEKNPLEIPSVKGVELQQKSLKTFFSVRKQGAVTTSIYRKSRNGEICKVLEDHSNTRDALHGVEIKEKCSGMLPDSKGSCKERVQDAALIIDSDDDEIQEISVTDFTQSTFAGKARVTGRKEIVLSRSNYR